MNFIIGLVGTGKTTLSSQLNENKQANVSSLPQNYLCKIKISVFMLNLMIF